MRKLLIGMIALVMMNYAGYSQGGTKKLSDRDTVCIPRVDAIYTAKQLYSFDVMKEELYLEKRGNVILQHKVNLRDTIINNYVLKSGAFTSLLKGYKVTEKISDEQIQTLAEQKVYYQDKLKQTKTLAKIGGIVAVIAGAIAIIK